MKRIRKSLAILLAAALSFGTVTIAAAEENAVAIDKEAFDSLLAAGKTADDAAIEANGWASAVKEAGVLRVGGTRTSFLFSQLDETDEGIRGFDAGLYQLLARYILGDESAFELTQVDSSTRESVLQSDQVDAVFATYSITPSRQEVISFAGPYYTSRQAVLVKAGNEDIGGVDDLAGRTVATQSGSTGPDILAEYAPEAVVQEFETDQEARQIANKREQLQRELGLRTMKRRGLDDIARLRALGEFHELNIIVKGDVDGSIEALSDSLIKLSTPEVQVNVIHKAVGAITESDVTLAAASDASIIGFQVRPSGAAKRLAEQDGVDIRIYSIIYDAIEEVKSAMEGMLSPDVKEEIIGMAEVRQVYHISKVGTIAGAMVTEGKIKRQCKVRVIRDGIVVFTGNLASLKRFKDDAKEVTSGYDCGLSIQSYNDLVEGDMIEVFEEIEVHKTL